MTTVHKLAALRTRPLHGFTIFELLAVITVITVLLTLLLPVLNSAKEVARRVGCVSNARQIGLAYHLYALDNRSTFPAANLGLNLESRSGNAHWRMHGRPFTIWDSPGYSDPWKIVNSYTDENWDLFVCPSDSRWFDVLGTSYSFVTGPFKIPGGIIGPTPQTQLTWHELGCWGRKVNKVKRAALQVLATELTWTWLNGQEAQTWNDPRNLPHDPDEQFGGQHTPSVSMSFVDGHSKFQLLKRSPDHYHNNEYDFASP